MNPEVLIFLISAVASLVGLGGAFAVTQAFELLIRKLLKRPKPTPKATFTKRLSKLTTELKRSSGEVDHVLGTCQPL